MPEPTLTPKTLRNLSIAQRNMLVDHINGPVGISLTNPRTIQGRNALIAQGLLQRSPEPARPHSTVLTELGRMALAAVLDEYAEVLIRAGYLEPQPISEALRHLKLRERALPVVPKLSRAEIQHNYRVRRSVE